MYLSTTFAYLFILINKNVPNEYVFIFREVIKLSPGPSEETKQRKKKEDRKRKRKHKDTSLEVPLTNNNNIVHMPVPEFLSLIQCICGSSICDAILLTCMYCGTINHRSCYSILIERVTHICGYCSVVYSDSVKSIYSIQDLQCWLETHQNRVSVQKVGDQLLD